MIEKPEIDRVADLAAAMTREVRALRWQVADVAGQGNDGSGDVERQVDGLLAKIARLESQLAEHLARLQPVIARKAEAVARSKGIGGLDAEHLAGGAYTHVGKKIDRFHSDKQKRQQADACAFEAWIATVIERLAIDTLRRLRPEIPMTNEDLEWHSRRYGQSKEGTQRVVPHAFRRDEERALDGMPAERRHLFLCMTGLWRLVSDQQRRLWSEFPSPSAWELNELNAWQRATRFTLALAEQEFIGLVQQQPELTDADFDAILKKIEQRSAHNLRRHFWLMLKLETAWMYLLRRIPELSETVLDDLGPSIDARSLVAWLVLDLWFACDTAERWFRWLAEVDAVHALDCNLGILMNLPMIEQGESHWNRRKVELACRFVGCHPDHADDPAAMLRVSSDYQAKLFDVARQIQHGKRDLDLCLAYHTVRQNPLQMIHSDSEHVP